MKTNLNKVGIYLNIYNTKGMQAQEKKKTNTQKQLLLL